MTSINLDISKLIQSFRSDFLDAFFLFITQFGDETVFLIVGAFLYWTFDKKFAYRFIMFFLYGAVLNGTLKYLTNTPRPYLEHPEEIQLIGEGSLGTSLPSGHAQNSTTMGLVLSEKFREGGKWLTTFLTMMVILVMLSRLYLGEHYLSDVIFGSAIAYSFYQLIRYVQTKPFASTYVQYLPLILLLPIAILTNDKNIFLASASIFGFSIGYPIERRYIGFKEKTSWYVAVIKLAFGLGIALAIRIGLKEVYELGLYSIHVEINPTLGDQLLDFLRYFLIAIWITLGAPFVFKKLIKTTR
jgi:membrane-associated phospholipid phosphatase